MLQRSRLHVQHDGAVQDEGAEFEERVKRQGAHVRFRPAVAALLHVFFELHPPEGVGLEFSVGF